MDTTEHLLVERPPRRAKALLAGVALAGALGGAVWAYLEYAGAARAPLLALALSGTFFGVAFTVMFAFGASFPHETLQGPRPAPVPSDEPPVDLGLGGRRVFLALAGGGAAALVGTALLPLRSLGTSPGRTLEPTAWARGVRLLTPDGRPLRPTDLAPGSSTPVVPSAAPDDPSSAAMLVRLGEAPEVRAYSAICTHAGCAVCVFLHQEGQLVCPCHFSVFDAAGGGRILSGPASRRLPELPLGLDPDGYLVAEGGFDGPIGPRRG